MKKLRIVIIAFVFLSTIYHLLPTISPVRAVTMISSQYQVKYANINIGGTNTGSSNYKLSQSIGQLAAGTFTSNGYVIKAGFQYWHSIIPFSFSLSSTLLNLNTLFPSTPTTATTNITVSFGSAGIYQVTAIEERPLQNAFSNTIPDTACNGGASTCTVSSAQLWDDNGQYGFGYNMTGNDIPADFVSSSYYRPFPNRAAAGTPAVVMSSTNVGRNRLSTLKVKGNVSNSQAGGFYTTVLNFVATPGY